jgi:multidrug transporter EmrE-like cation transporter
MDSEPQDKCNCNAKALQILPVGTAYAVWTGIGAAGTVVAVF